MRRSKRGFSLLEVVIAVFVFMTTVAGVLSVWTAHARGIEKARMTLVANQLGEELMAECQAARFELVDEFHDPAPGSDPPVEIDFIVKDKEISAKFYRSVTVTEIVPGAIKEVRVRVEWTDATTPHADLTNYNPDHFRHVEFVTELHESA
jgi:Tfp pilus assembly protein PilV